MQLSIDLPQKKLRHMTGRNTTWGVFKAYAFFFTKEMLLVIPKNDIKCYKYTTVVANKAIRGKCYGASMVGRLPRQGEHPL